MSKSKFVKLAKPNTFCNGDVIIEVDYTNEVKLVAYSIKNKEIDKLLIDEFEIFYNKLIESMAYLYPKNNHDFIQYKWGEVIESEGLYEVKLLKNYRDKMHP